VQVITAGKSGEKVYEERGHGLFTMQQFPLSLQAQPFQHVL
jgi:hypothetical protein